MIPSGIKTCCPIHNQKPCALHPLVSPPSPPPCSSSSSATYLSGGAETALRSWVKLHQPGASEYPLRASTPRHSPPQAQLLIVVRSCTNLLPRYFNQPSVSGDTSQGTERYLMRGRRETVWQHNPSDQSKTCRIYRWKFLCIASSSFLHTWTRRNLLWSIRHLHSKVRMDSSKQLLLIFHYEPTWCFFLISCWDTPGITTNNMQELTQLTLNYFYY